MKVNMVTGKPAGGGVVRCLKISETADEVIDFFTTLRGNKGVMEDTGEKFVSIALFQRPTTTKRSTFHENEAAPEADDGKAPDKPKGKGSKAAKAASGEAAQPQTSAVAGGSEEDTGI